MATALHAMRYGRFIFSRDTGQPREKESYFKKQIKPSIFLDAVSAIIQV